MTIYTFLIPILGDDSVVKARTIWCSKNNAQVWRTWMLQGVMPPRPMGSCDVEALDRNLDLADALPPELHAGDHLRRRLEASPATPTSTT